MPDKNSVFDTISKIIAQQLSIDKDNIKLTSNFDDLGMDSVDRIEIIMKLEETFNIEIKDEDADSFKNVSDAVEHIAKLVKE